LYLEHFQSEQTFGSSGCEGEYFNDIRIPANTDGSGAENIIRQLGQFFAAAANRSHSGLVITIDEAKKALYLA
jgi:hypothetical protein